MIDVSGELTVAVYAEVPADTDEDDVEQALAEQLHSGTVLSVDIHEQAEPATDGGTLVEGAESTESSSPTKAILRVLDEGHSDGVERVDVIDRAAAHSEATRENVESALEDLRKRGEVYGFDGLVKKTPGGSKEERWGGFS